MARYTIEGGRKLDGEVRIQGGKNSAMKHVLTPLITNEECVITNVPDISSCHRLAEIISIHGGNVRWNKNEVRINTATVKESVIIPEEVFFHTSGGVLAIPLLVNKVGKCIVENKSGRTDTGGDQIGRPFNLDLYPQVGIQVIKNDGQIEFTKADNKPFKYNAMGKFAPSVIAVFSALGRDGVSEIINTVDVEEFRDTVELINAMGGEIRSKGRQMLVKGGSDFKGMRWENLADKNDLVTWISVALATESHLVITGVPLDRFKLDGLFGVLTRMGVEFEVREKEGIVEIKHNMIADLKPVEVVADLNLGFTSEWQVLLSPIWALIAGESWVTDNIQADRMWHWEELGKMGARYRYQRDGRYTEVGGRPRVVTIEGVSKLKGVQVKARDLRSAATLLIAGMAAEGTTVVMDEGDNLNRGYEGFVERAKLLGANIQTT